MLPTLFNYEGKQLRTVSKDGEPWFVASDVCEILGLSNSRMTVSRLDEDEKGVSIIDTPGGLQESTIINEPGLYSLVLTSNKPEAKKFKRWITHEVIPSIRKNGSYSVQLTPTEALLKSVELLAQQEKELKELKDAQSANQAVLIDHTFALSSLEQKVTNEITITTREQAQIQGAVKAKIGRLGDNSLYSKLYGALKRQFGVPSYRDLRKTDLSRAFQFIKAWSPTTYSN